MSLFDSPIHRIRESIKVVTKLLSNRNVPVYQRGMDAYVSTDAITGEIKHVVLPYLPDTASEELIMAVQGFLDHEVGHILFTDFSEVTKYAHDKNIISTWNVFEDPFVESCMRKRFPGSAFNIDNLHRFFIDKVVDKNFQELKERGVTVHPLAYISCLFPAISRAWMGFPEFEKYMAADNKWALVQPVLDILPKDLPERMMNSTCTADNMSMAIDVMAHIEKGKASLDRGEDEKEKFGEGEPSLDEGESGEGGLPPDEEFKDEFEKSKGGGESEEESDDEPSSESPDEFSDEEEFDDSDDGEEFDDSDSSEDGEDDDGDRDDEGTDGKLGEDLEDEEKLPPTASEADYRKGKTDVEFDDGEDDGEDAGDDAVGDAEKHSDDSEVESDSSRSGGDIDVGHDEEGIRSSEETDDTGDTAKEESPFEEFELPDLMPLDIESIGDYIGDMAADAAREANYMVYSTEHDVVAPPELPDDERSMAKIDKFVKAMHELVAPLASYIQSDFKRTFFSMNRVYWQGGLKSGKVNPSALSRLFVGDNRVFRKKEEIRTEEFDVTLLIDDSGSMMGTRITNATYAAYAMGNALDSIGVNFEILGFTTLEERGLVDFDRTKDDLRKARERGVSYSRFTPLNVPVFKAFSEKWGPTCFKRLALYAMDERYDYLRENADGECVEIAAKRLMKESARGKMLIVLSDGAPCCGSSFSYDPRAMSNHLKTTVKKIENAGVKVVGIGIQTNSVAEFYKDYAILSDITKLPQEVISKIKGVMLR